MCPTYGAVTWKLQQVWVLKKGADKSLARPGRKKSYSDQIRDLFNIFPRSSIRFLAHCSNFCKPLKKYSEGYLSSQVSAAAMTSASDEKWRTFNCFFQSREQVVVQRGHIRRIGWVIMTLKAQVGQFLLDCECPVRRGILVQEQDSLGDLPKAFSFEMSFNCTSRDE